MRYVLVQDDDCHWYVIPQDKITEWWQFVPTMDDNLPDWARPVGGDPSLVSFTDPTIGGVQ